MKCNCVIFLFAIFSNYAIAQIANNIAFDKASIVIDYLLKDELHSHHQHSKIPGDTKLVNVEIENQRATFYIEMSLEVFEDDYYEMLYEELGLRMFNVLSEEMNLKSFEVLLKNEKGKFIPLSNFQPFKKDDSYTYFNEDKGDGGAPINLSNINKASKHNPNVSQTQAQGNLSGKTVWLSPGHGWLYYTSVGGYTTQRGETNDMVEDFGTIEGINYYLLKYLWNAGANLWSVRERDVNDNEVVVDNTSAGYSETGTWSTTSNTGYNPLTTDFDQANGYRFSAVTTGAATSTATWQTAVPKSGWYWVSVAYRAFSDRPIDAQYEVNHTGGITKVSINQEVHGETWVYLGQFYFDAGITASVTLLNATTDTSASQFVIADAVRFGGGMGTEQDCTYGAGTTGKSRFEECARMYAPFQNYPTCRGDVTIRPNYAEWELAKGTIVEQNNAVYVSWHTNAATGTARGTETYSYNGSSTGFPITPGSANLRNFVHNQLAGDIINCWDANWNDRGVKTANFGELRELSTMPGCLIEVAFHDEPNDANALTTPEFRKIAARGIYQGIVDFFADRDGTTPVYLPEPPTHLYAKNTATGQITLTWNAPPTACGSGTATAYKVYMSTHGKGFKDGISTTGNSYTINGLNPNTTYYFRVSATNTGGESFQTATVAARTPASGSTVPYLIVDGFDRLDRASAIRKTSSPQLTDLRRLFLELMNSYDYMVEHAKALESCGVSFDGVSNEAVISGAAILTNYDAIDWFTGEESTVNNTFDVIEQQLLQNYLDNNGCLIVSGAEIGWDIGRSNSPNASLSFYNNYLKATYVGDDAGTYNIASTGAGIFSGISGFFDDNTNCYFDAEFPDRLAAFGGSTVDLLYNGGTNDGAAITYKGSDFALVYFGFPLETTDAATRDALMCAAVNYLASEHETCATVDLNINFDNFPSQTNWEILDANNVTVASGGNYNSQAGYSNVTESVCLEDGCYSLVMNDALGNGMCPFQSSAVGVSTFITPGTLISPGSIVGTLSLVATPGLCGSYNLTDADGTVLNNGGGAFGTSQIKGFCLNNGLAPRLLHPVSKAKLQVHPIITNDVIKVSYQIDEYETATVLVVDLNGKVWLKEPIINNYQIDLNVQNLISGNYFVQVHSSKGSMARQFVKR